MFSVQNRHQVIRDFNDHNEAMGYLVSYVACSGQTCMLLSPGDAMKTFAVARREHYGCVSVRIFGNAIEANDYFKQVA
jgi:hypothetical protein